MKKLFSFILLAVVAISAKAQLTVKNTLLMTKTLAADDIKNVLSETSGGNITVTGVAASEAKIEVYVAPNNSRQNNLTEQEIRQRVSDDYDLKIETLNNKLTATAKAKERDMDWKKALNISFIIYVPNNVSVDLSTSGGNISLTNLSGTLAFSTSGGNLVLEKITGKIKGRTSGGNVDVADSKEDIDLGTSGGNIHAKNCEGKLKLATSGGSLILSGLKGNIKAITSGGNVNGTDIEGDLVTNTSGGNIVLNRMSCNLETSTSGGSIHVEIKDLRKSISISNSAGRTDVILPSGKGVDLKLTGDKIKTDKLENFSGKVEDDEITGKLNGGGTSVTVKAGSGRVYLGFAKN